MYKGWARFAGLVLALAAADAAAVDWFADGEATLTSDSNVSRAEHERDTLADASALVAAGLNLRTQPTFSTALNARAFAEAEKWRDLDALDRTTAGGQLIGRWQPVRGFRAPVLQLTLTGQLDDYDTDQRDSLVYTAQISATQHVNDRIVMSYGVEGVERRSDGTVFDTTHGRAFVSADFELDAKWTAYTAFSHLRGDTFSSAQFTFCNGASANDIFGLIGASKAFESDEAFNKNACGSWIAYRLKSFTNAYTAGFNYGISHHLSLDVSAQKVMVFGQGDNDYDRVLLRAGLLARF